MTGSSNWGTRTVPQPPPDGGSAPETPYADVRARAEAAWQAYIRPPRPRIDVTVATCSHAAGVGRTLAAIRATIAERGYDAGLSSLSCGGMCFLEPLVIITQTSGRRVLYGPVTPDQVQPLLAATIASAGVYDQLAVATIPNWGTARVPQPPPDGGAAPETPAGEGGPPPLAEHFFMKDQVRWLMENVGITDPDDLDHYIARGGYEGLSKALEMPQEEIIKLAVDSGIWGRGGAGFPAGRKWDFLRGARTTPKYMVCNADEGDPGAFVNRILLEGDPGLVVEGMTIAAAATGAAFGYIYIRDEYPLAIERTDRALQQARERGLLGTNILGSELTYDMAVVRGAGAYVCGEETGLLSSIQDSRGMPRIKPPFPANAGVFGLPTNVNNVETYACAPLAFRNGVDWYRSVGTEKSPGTKMFSITGDVRRTGALEVPFGTPTSKLVNDACGGVPEGRTLHIIQPGGPLLGLIPAQAIDTPLDLDPYREWKLGGMGGGGLVIGDDTSCPIDLVTYFEWFAEDESCGRCTTCHGGTQRYVEILRRIQEGGGRMSDIELLNMLSESLVWSNCFHGQGAPAAVKCLLWHFNDELLEHIQGKRCRAKVCRGLIRYEVDPAHAGDVAAGAAICPTNAIQQAPDGRYAIDQSLCIRCNACKEVQPEAIRLEDAFPVAVSVAAD